MKKIWYLINITLVTLGLPGGYNELSPEKLQHKNPDAIFCGAILLLMPLFAILIVGYSIQRWNHTKLARPSLDRNPLNWWHDPLQSLFVTTCIASAATIGGLLRRPQIGSVGFWMVGASTCFALGLFVGQVLVYRIYRENILATRTRTLP